MERTGWLGKSHCAPGATLISLAIYFLEGSVLHVPVMPDNSDVMYRLLVQGVTDYAIYMLDPQGLVVNWNAGAERAKGYRAEEIVGAHFSRFYTAHERAAGLPEQSLEIARAQGRFESEGQRVRKDGTLFWTHVVIDAIHDQGRLLGFTKITRDITERRRYELELVAAKELAEQYSEERAAVSSFLESVIAHIPSSVIVQDAVSRKVLLINRQAECLLGAASQSLVGHWLTDSRQRGLGGYLDRLTDQCLRQEGVHQEEGEQDTALGLRTLRSKALTIRGQEPDSSYALLIAEDITDEHAAHAQIHHMAHHDSLTSLPNRTLFRERLNEALHHGEGMGTSTAVLCLDLDNFKNVNDALGHQFGDKLLHSLSVRLRDQLREQDTLARLGGDEFAVVLPHISHSEDAQHTAERLIAAAAPAFLIDGQQLSVGLSVGIALAPQDHTTADHLLRCADMALYEAKRNGRNRYEVFRLELDETARKRRTLEMELRVAITQRQLQLYYQPIIERAESRVIGYEALMRWHHPVNGLVLPMDFIPMAEETGLIHELGALALHLACHEAVRWAGGESVAVNLSPVQFKNAGFVSVVESALLESGLSPERLELEITESVLLDNNAGNLDILQRLKALGVRIALDDFGTGYSSLSYLRSFPFDKIKIDKSFINDMGESREALAIVRAITGMGSSLQIQTTAEGVETQAQYERLIAEGCSHFQGYLFGRPSPKA